MKKLIRSLARTYPTAQAIHAHLATTCEVHRRDPVTFADLLAAIGSDSVRLLDAQLSATGNTWLQQQLASSGIDLADGAYRAEIASLTEVPAQTRTDILSLGICEKQQWAAYGLSALPSIAEIEACLSPDSVDGHAISVAVNVSPTGDNVAVSITALAGTERLGVVHSFTSGRRGLSKAQNDFLAALIALAKAYREEVT